MSIVASLVISGMSLANSIMFEQSAFAVDNCDATATCINEQFGSGTGNSQINNCSKQFLFEQSHLAMIIFRLTIVEMALHVLTSLPEIEILRLTIA